MKFELFLSLIFGVFEKHFFKQSRHDMKDGDTPANKWDVFKNYILGKLLLTSVLSVWENCNIFWKIWLAESLPVNVF